MTTCSETPLIYLAGPDCFLPHAPVFYAAAQDTCRQYGLACLLPSDGGHLWKTPGERASLIYRDNMESLQRADGIVANLNPFRGFEPDSGTVFEVATALARGIPIVAYVADDRPLLYRLTERVGATQSEEGWWDLADGHLVENFGLPVNLMLARAVPVIQGDIHAALRRMANLITTRAAAPTGS